ncbi:MAG: ABC transporter substrate-binding protein [Actinomycetia bacterium]|nr:ABC transporter substrate-binding protein [Actinomycetes bacterium]
MKPLDHRRVVAATLAGALLLTACSALEPPRDPVAEAPAEAVVGGTLRVGITEPGAIDPMSTTTTAGRLIAATMCDTLLVRDPVTNQLREGIADTWVEASNGTFVTIRPMHETLFNDGTRLQATDISFTMRELVARVNDSPYAALGTPFSGGVIRGASSNEAQERPEDLLVDSGRSDTDLAQPLNDYDVQAQSQTINANTAGVFAEPALAPISRVAFERDDAAFRADPVCVGPYRLESPRRPSDTVITLVRFSDYHGQNLGYTSGGTGYADRIEFHIYPTSAHVDQAYASGEIDVAQVLPRPLEGEIFFPPLMPEPPIEPALDPADLVRGAPTGVEYLGITSTTEGVWSSPVVRRAVSMAVDREAIARAIGPYAEPAQGFLPDALAVQEGRRGREDGRAIDIPQCRTPHVPAQPDPEGARALLTEAGIDLRDLELDMDVPIVEGDATAASVARLVRAQLEEAFGMRVYTNPVEWIYFKDRLEEGAGAVSGLFRTAWATSVIAPVPTYNDAWIYLRSLVSYDGAAAANVGGWSSPVMDGILTDLRGTPDQSEQSRHIGRAVEYLCEELPYIPLVSTAPVWRVRHTALGSARGEVATGSDGQLLLRELFVKQG